MLAAWLFMQFLLTNDVQIAYSKTEGYVPVTEKAHNDATYIEYLNSADENSSEFYSVKIDLDRTPLFRKRKGRSEKLIFHQSPKQ